MSERVRLAMILAEDERSANLLRRYVNRAIDVQKTRVKIAPKGRGCAYDWIIQQYPDEVKEQRHCVLTNSRNHAVLVVHIDADNLTVADRMNQLASALTKAEGESRQSAERIAVCVPKRNAETWIHGLTGVGVNETYDFKRDPESRIAINQRKREELCSQRMASASEQLYQLTRNNADPAPSSMPSVATAVHELRRLEQ